MQTVSPMQTVPRPERSAKMFSRPRNLAVFWSALFADRLAGKDGLHAVCKGSGASLPLAAPSLAPGQPFLCYITAAKLPKQQLNAK